MGLKRKSTKPQRRKAKTQDTEYFQHHLSLADDGTDWNTTKFCSKDTPETRLLIINALNVGHTLSGAAVKAGIHPVTLRRWRDSDEDFARLIDEAQDIGSDFIEEEVRRRAVQGTDRPVFQGGAMVGVVREYSDKLTEYLLTARKPDKFGKNRFEHGGVDGQPIQYQTEVTFVAPLKQIGGD